MNTDPLCYVFVFVNNYLYDRKVIIPKHYLSLHNFIIKCICSSTGHDECLILFGDSQGAINILVITSAGECLRYISEITL